MTALNASAEPDPYVDQRQHPRVSVALPAFLILGGRRYPVQIVDLSSGGAKVDCGAALVVAGAVDGRTCGAAALTRLAAAVDAAPHRFVAREPLEEATLPALVDGALHPRTARLRVFSVVIGGAPRALPAPWTRLAGRR